MGPRHRWTRRHRQHPSWQVGVAAAGAAVLAAAAIWAATGSASAGTLTAAVSVDAGRSLGTFPETEVGANLAVWDGLLADSQTGALMKDAGVRYLRYPGGSYGDIYHWQTGLADNGGYVAPNTGFDQFMGMARTAGAQPILIANYGSGTPTEAADWVRYANVTKGYGVRYWEVGNEVYGNGHYGSGWENDTHADKSPRAYATNFLQFVAAMKAVDPTVKIGVVLTAPGGWPDGVVGSGDSADWNDTVLSVVGNKADFAIFHYYPGGANEADMLTRPQTLASTVSAFKADLSKWGVGTMPIFVTEVNGGAPRTTQAQALWAADMYLAAAESGVANVSWWNVHNGAGSNGTDVTGATDHGDEGIIANGSGSEPAAQTPFKPYYGIQMLSRVAAGGDTLLGTTSSQAKVSVHAVRRAGGGVDVLLINKDPNNSYAVNLDYSGFTPSSSVTVDTFGLGSTSITSGGTGTATSQTIPPYSLVAVHTRSAGGASTGSQTGVQTGTQPGSQTGGPTGPGGPSTSSSGARPSTGSPSSGSPSGACVVAYSTNSWGAGFTASVTVTNRGTAPVDGWTLGWIFPGNQSVTSTWNATVTQSGTQVTAKNVAYNAAIAVNGNANFGFQASYTGANEAPPTFTLNGTSCTVQ